MTRTSKRRSSKRPLTVADLRSAVRHLPADLLFPRDQWDRDQKTHWIRWLSNFDPGYPAARVYGAIQCPHLLVYLVWALDIDRDRFGQTLSLFPFDPKKLTRACGSQSRRVRELFPWEEVQARLWAVKSRV